MSNSPPMHYQAYPLTDRLHKQAYEAIHPSNPHLSQAGKAVLITGGAAGIGFAIARAFALAAADRVLIVGRDQDKLDAAVEALAEEFKCNATKTLFEGRTCQSSDPKSIEQLWDTLRTDGIHVDVLVLNAVLGGYGKMWDLGWQTIWRQFEVNVRSLHHFSDRFDQQQRAKNTSKYLINVSSGAIHEWAMATEFPSYALTKHSAALLMQQLASERDASQMQIISFHPGAVLTQNARDGGFNEDSLNWDNADLPGAFAVWCASPESAFLHGRFVWSAWDITELKGGKLRERLEVDEKFLRIGVHGL